MLKKDIFDEGHIHTIKNPFLMNSFTPVRLTLDKAPHSRHDTTYCSEYIDNTGNHILHNELNNSLSYTFGKDETYARNEKQLIDPSNVDYSVPAEILNKGREKDIHKDPLPLSFIQIKNEVEGIEWYKKNYPKIPTDLLPIIARYHWGEPITKKAIKQEKKKIEKKAQAKGLVIDKKPHIVSFD